MQFDTKEEAKAACQMHSDVSKTSKGRWGIGLKVFRKRSHRRPTIESATRDSTVAESDLAKIAMQLLRKLEDMTTDEFSKGGERNERLALRAELVRLGILRE